RAVDDRGRQSRRAVPCDAEVGKVSKQVTLGAAAAASGDGKLGVADLRHRGRLRARRVEAAVALLIVGIQGTFFHPPQWNQSARLAATVAFVEPNTPYTRSFRIDGLKDGDRLPTEDVAASRGGF